MSSFCDVALPIPLDRSFTYGLSGAGAEIGARVLVPFAGRRLVGFVTRVHDEAPPAGVEVKPVDKVLDDAALLGTDLLELGRWVAEYYCAPLGEVLRGMVPLGAEVRQQFVYRIAEAGRRVLYEGAAKGSSRRSRLTVEEQNREYAVLNYLESGEACKISALRSATGANKALLDAMAKKRWLVREAVAEARDARRVEQIAVLVEQSAVSAEGGATAGGGRRLPKLNENQLAAMAELAGAGGSVRVRELQARLTRAGVPETTLGTLQRRGLVRLEQAAQAFQVTGLAQTGGKRFAHEHSLNEAQTEALAGIAAALSRGGFEPPPLDGLTGCVCGGHAAGAGGGEERSAAGAGDRFNAGDRGTNGRRVWERGSAAAFTADAG